MQRVDRRLLSSFSCNKPGERTRYNGDDQYELPWQARDDK